jgi:small subunit ribosomal protein S11
MGKKRIIKENEEETARGGKVSAEAASPGAQQVTRRINQLTSSRIYVSASYNNTCISVTDERGNVLVWSSSGALGFKGPRKATPYAASKVIENIFEKLGPLDLGKVSVYVQGVGSGRDGAIRALAGRGLNIIALEDVTPLPHNGCRPRKARRV